MKVRYLTAVAVAVICTGIAGCSPSSDGGQSAQSADEAAVSAAPPDPEDVAKAARPADQAALIALLGKATAVVNSAPNDIAHDQREVKWANILCSAKKNISTFKDWTGTVLEIDRSGAFKVDIGSDIFLEDFAVPPSPLFISISRLQYKEAVKISGSFVHGEVNDDCNNEWWGGDTAVHITDISPINSPGG